MKEKMNKMKIYRKLAAILVAAICFGSLTVYADDIPEDVFSGNVTDNIKWTLSADGTLVITGKGAIPDYDRITTFVPWNNESYPEIKKVVIGEGITRIGDYTFYLGEKIKSVSLPSTLESVGKFAFYWNFNVEDLKLPENLKVIEDNGFDSAFHSNSYETLSMPNVAYIGNNAFESIHVNTLTIPSNVKHIGYLAFNRATIDTLNYETETNIPRECFEYSEIKSVNISGKPEEIGESAFSNNTGLEEVKIGDGVERIDAYAFAECPDLKSIEFPDTLTFISGKAFDQSPDFTSKYPSRLHKNAAGDYVLSDNNSSSSSGTSNVKKSEENKDASSEAMYRLYNPNSGEHFFTADEIERDDLKASGWKYEGIAWNAPQSSKRPVYRLYNPNAGEHHYTASSTELDMLIQAGWKFEGVGWYSASKKQTPVYRAYNPNALANNHHYTTDKDEVDKLVGLGWQNEGIGWYAE